MTIRLSIAFTSLFLFASSMSFSQPEKGQVGLSVLLQNPQFDFIIPYWFQEQLVLAPAVSFNSISSHATDFGIGGILRYYIAKNQVSPYTGVRAGALIFTPKRGSSTTDYLVGPFFGAEYFFDAQFSIGIELQLNVAFSHKSSSRFGNPNGTNVNTASALFASVYF